MATMALVASASAWSFTHWYRGGGESELRYEFGDGVVSAEWTPTLPLSLRGGPHFLMRNTGGWGIQWPSVTTRVESKPFCDGKYIWPGKPTRYFNVVVPLWLPTLISGRACSWLWRRIRRPQPGFCAQCCYDLTGNTSGVCPECGLSVPKLTPVQNEALPP